MDGNKNERKSGNLDLKNTNRDIGKRSANDHSGGGNKKPISFWKNSILTLTQVPVRNLSMKTCAVNLNKPIYSEIKVLNLVYTDLGSKTFSSILNLYRGISMTFCFSVIDQIRESLVDLVFDGGLKLISGNGNDDKKPSENDKYLDWFKNFVNISTKATLFLPYNFLLDTYVVSPANYPFIKVLLGVILREQLGVTFNIKGCILLIIKLVAKILIAPFTTIGLLRYLILGGFGNRGGILNLTSTHPIEKINTNDQINNLFYAAIPTLLLFIGKKLIRNSIHSLELHFNEKHQQYPENKFYFYSNRLFSSHYFRGTITGILNCPLEVLRLYYVGSFIQSYIDTIDYTKISSDVDHTELLSRSIPLVVNPISLAAMLVNKYGFFRLFNGVFSFILSNIFIEYYKKKNDHPYDYFDIFKI